MLNYFKYIALGRKNMVSGHWPFGACASTAVDVTVYTVAPLSLKMDVGSLIAAWLCDMVFVFSATPGTSSAFKGICVLIGS